jgi:hypothetical protein
MGLNFLTKDNICTKLALVFPKVDIAFLRKMRYDVTDLNEVKNIEPENVMQL